MRYDLPTHWWAFILRGVVAIILGLVTFAWPGITLAGLVIMFGAYALLDGIVSIAGAWHAIRSHDRWGAPLVEGIAGIIAAVLTAIMPGITALALVFIIAAWSLVTGVFEVVAAVRLRKYITGEWMLALSGVISIIFGMLLMIAPAAGALAIALWFGIYVFIFGVILIGLGIRLRHWRLPGTQSSMPLPSRQSHPGHARGRSASAAPFFCVRSSLIDSWRSGVDINRFTEKLVVPGLKRPRFRQRCSRAARPLAGTR